jgi:hypothetical protein
MATVKELQAERTKLQEEVVRLNKEEARIMGEVTAERIAAAERGPQSDSEVGNSQPDERKELHDIHDRIMQCYTDIARISDEIIRSLGVKGGRRRKTRRHRRKHRKTLRRK